MFIHDAVESFFPHLRKTQCHVVDIFVWERQEIGQGVNGQQFVRIFCWWCKNEWHFIRNNGIKGVTEKIHTFRSQTQQTLHHFVKRLRQSGCIWKCESLHSLRFSRFECIRWSERVGHSQTSRFCAASLLPALEIVPKFATKDLCFHR